MMFDYTATYTDQYQVTMSQVYFHKGMRDETAIFDYFFRKLPFEGGYAVFAGLEDLLNALENFRFDQKDLAFLEKEGMDRDFLDYLEDFRFTGNIYAAKEGDLIFPNRPVLSVEAPIIEAQLLETLTLNTLNYQSLIATKASRMRLSAGNRKLVDFGLRRAPEPADIRPAAQPSSADLTPPAMCAADAITASRYRAPWPTHSCSATIRR
ncbi:MAG: hypothetical protein U5K31_12255 [Balneolaceae bacterium]|nr:hypothetical protein [Balneolaceae bacterium]